MSFVRDTLENRSIKPKQIITTITFNMHSSLGERISINQTSDSLITQQPQLPQTPQTHRPSSTARTVHTHTHTHRRPGPQHPQYLQTHNPTDSHTRSAWRTTPFAWHNVSNGSAGEVIHDTPGEPTQYPENQPLTRRTTQSRGFRVRG